MIEIDVMRNVVANLQIDNYQLNQKIERLEEKLEVIELKMDQVLDLVGDTSVH